MTNRTFSEEAHAVNRAADALRQYEMNGRVLLPWDRISTSQRAKWIDKAETVLYAYKASHPRNTAEELKGAQDE